MISAPEAAEQIVQVSSKESALRRVGFLGTGWIGQHRLEAMARSGCIEAAAIAEPAEELARAAAQCARECEVFPTFEAMLAEQLDAVVIATPSALHAEPSAG